MSLFMTVKSPELHLPGGKVFEKLEAPTWQQQFAGRWKKIERRGFYEFLLANGLLSLAAYLLKDADCGQVFTFDEHNDHRFQLKATGTPTITLPWCKIGKTADDAELVSDKDPSGAPFEIKFWYDEKEQVLRSWSRNPKRGLIAEQTREIDENGHMIFTHIATLSDGRSVSHSVILKKVA